MNRYHNTTESTQPELAKYRQKASSQDDQLLEFFKKVAPIEYTPSQLLGIVFKGSVPITSVRRALTNLTNQGDLVKTGEQINGPYGRPEFKWRLAEKTPQREMF